MHRKLVQILLLALVGALVLTAAGCGKKKSSTTTVTTTAAPATTAAAATTQAAATTTSAATTEASGTTTAASSDLGSLASVANCTQLKSLGAAFAQALQGANGDLGKSADLMKQFAEKTPSDIRPDFEVVAAALAKYADTLKGVDLTSGKTPDAATIAKLTKLASEIDTPALTKAESNISAWAAKNCHS